MVLLHAQQSGRVYTDRLLRQRDLVWLETTGVRRTMPASPRGACPIQQQTTLTKSHSDTEICLQVHKTMCEPDQRNFPFGIHSLR
ncbi:hypothetical protein BaRGS_00022521 [Batillaria attramentaria]|uniref:Uncharacterized protein n=1 Tax=Batillaria attramentaria TaxID=370345 RepID=A0ABD0KGN0_9CAEN